MRTPSKFSPGGRALRHQSGVALILVLATLFVVVIIVVGFTLAMQLERQASQSSAANTQVDFIAQAAISHATAVLANNIPPVASGIGTDTSAQIATSGNATNWWVNPGLLSTQSGTSAPKLIKLYTSNNSTSASADSTAPAGSASVDLNRPLLTNPSVHTITGLASTQPMNFAWVNVLQDPGGVHQPNPQLPKYNPIVGRYAFWMEPENSRIDVTTAMGKTASLDVAPKAPSPATYNDYGHFEHLFSPGIVGSSTTPLQYSNNGINPTVGNVAMVDLSVLNGISGIDANALFLTQQYIARGLATPMTEGSSQGGAGNTVPPPPGLDDVAQIKNFFLSQTNGQSFYDNNRFYLTNYSRDPEFNVFGGSRICANDNQEPGSGLIFEPYLYSSYQYYLNVNEPLWFDTNNSTSNGRSLAAIHYLATLMQSASWPGYTGSHAGKWATKGTTLSGNREADQVAWNIYGIGGSILTDYRGISGTAYPGSDNQFVYSANTTDTFDKYGVNPPGSSPDQLGPILTSAVGGTMWDGNGTVPNSRYLPRSSQLLIDEIVFSLGSGTFTNSSNQPAYEIYIQDSADYVFPAGMQSEHSGDMMNLWFSQSSTSLDYETVTTVGYLQYDISVNGGAFTTLTPTSTTNPVNLLLAGGESAFAGTGGSTPGYLTIAPNVLSTPGPPPANAPIYSPSDPSTALSPDTTRLLTAATSYPDTNGGVGYHLGDQITIKNIKFKMATCQHTSFSTELMPLYARAELGAFGQNTGYCEPSTQPADADALLTIAGPITFTITGTAPTPSVNSAAIMIGDPRLDGNSTAWVADPNYPRSLASPNYLNSAINGGFSDTSKLALNFKGDYYPWNSQDDYPDVSPGQYFYASTGVQRNLPFETLSLLPAGSKNGGSTYSEGRNNYPPDYLLLDLLYSPYRTTSMNSSRGKININSIIYPPYVGNTLVRLQPLEALFKNLSVNGTAISAAQCATIAQDIQTEERTLNGFRYSGELAEVTDLENVNTSNQWTKEALLRALAGVITTRSNSFGVWGAAQSVKETPGGTIIPIADKHFHAIIERGVWPGVDGMRGNGYYNASSNAFTMGGTYEGNSSSAPGATVNDVLDGPDQVPAAPPNANLTGITTIKNFLMPPGTPGNLFTISNGTTPVANRIVYNNTNTVLEKAYNPLAPYMQYKTVEFKYLNE